MRGGRLPGRAFPAGLALIALGIVMIGLGAVLDHYDMTRVEWYIGESGLFVLGAGSVLALVAVLFVLMGGGDISGPASGGPAGGKDGGADG